MRSDRGAVPGDTATAKMDMDMDMGGHSHSANGFQPTNMELARTFWYIVVVALGLFAACRVMHLYASEMRSVPLSICLPKHEH